MRIASLQGGGVGLVDGDRVLDLRGAGGDGAAEPRSVGDLAAMGLDDARRWVDERAASARSLPIGDVALAAPVPAPSKVVAAPVNYADHQEEMRQRYDVSGLGVFLKAPSSVIGPGQHIRLPYVDRRFDQEGELAVVLGATARHVPAERALDAVFGYTCLVDVTMRGGEDRSTRKSFDTFTPTGPWVTTADDVGDPGALDLVCAVNGEVRQRARTRDLIWGVDRLVAYVSSVMTLLPGDLLATGTPAGVGPIEHGDVVEVTISRIGTLVVGVSAEGAVTCPTRGAEHGPVAPERSGR